MLIITSRNFVLVMTCKIFMLPDFAVPDAICGEATCWQYAFGTTKDATCRNATYWHASNRNASSSGTTFRCVSSNTNCNDCISGTVLSLVNISFKCISGIFQPELCI